MITYRTQLPDLMREHGLPMTAAEIGVAEGFNSNDLLQNGIEKLWMIDIWQHEKVQGDGSMPEEWHNKNYTQAMERVAPFGDKAVPMKGFSKDMALQIPDESLGLVYIDAGHSYEDCLLDLQTWFPKLVRGGVMAGHDYLNRSYGVYPAVWNFTMGGRMYEVFTIKEDKDEDAGFYFFKP